MPPRAADAAQAALARAAARAGRIAALDAAGEDQVDQDADSQNVRRGAMGWDRQHMSCFWIGVCGICIVLWVEIKPQWIGIVFNQRLMLTSPYMDHQVWIGHVDLFPARTSKRHVATLKKSFEESGLRRGVVGFKTNVVAVAR